MLSNRASRKRARLGEFDDAGLDGFLDNLQSQTQRSSSTFTDTSPSPSSSPSSPPPSSSRGQSPSLGYDDDDDIDDFLDQLEASSEWCGPLNPSFSPSLPSLCGVFVKNFADFFFFGGRPTTTIFIFKKTLTTTRC